MNQNFTEQPRRVFGYCRTSNFEGTPEKTIEEQIKDIETYAKSKNWTISHFFIDEKKIQDSLNELLPKRKGENVIKNLNESKISALNYAKKFEKRENFY